MSKPEEPITLTANDIETEPGIGRPADVLVLLRENNRLRYERNDWRQRAELAELTVERSSMPPTPKQRAVGWSLKLGKWGALLTLLPPLGVVLGKLWPDYADLIELVTGWVK